MIAGGFGTRLRPLTLTRPKHLLPIANRPHLHHVFDLLQRHGIDEIVLLTSYMAETFAGVVAEAEGRGMTVHVAHEETPLGTAGALKNAEALIDGDRFFAFNGDILTTMDLGAIAAWHRDRAAEATIVLTPVDDPSAYGVVPTDEGGRVLGFIEKPPAGTAPTNLINAGVYLFEPTILDRIPAGVEYSAERGLFPGLVSEGAALYATPTDAYWMDIGTPQKYLAANLDALGGRFATDAVAEPGPHTALVATDAEVDRDARVSSSCIGPGAQVARDAVVEGSVLLPGVRIGVGARVVGSVLGEGVVVDDGAVIEDETLGDRERVSA